MRKILPLCALLIAALTATAAPVNLTGLWDAVVVVNTVEIPFRLEIEQNGPRARGFFFEGDRRIGSTSGSFENGALKLGYDFLNTTLEATVNGSDLRGTYQTNPPHTMPKE